MKSIHISKLAPLLAAATAGFALAPSELAAQGTVVGGSKNAAPGGISVVVGGAKNRSVGGGSVIVGGNTNRANGDNSAIVTGFQNTTGTTGKFSGIGAGSNNLITGQGSFIGSGNKNTASGLSTIVLGGTDNTCFGQFSVIGGGRRNTLNAKESYLFGNDINYTSNGDTGMLYLADNSRGGTPLAQNFTDNQMICRFNSGLLFFANSTSNNADLVVSATGNVGIKTLNPGVPLDVSGNGVGWRHNGTGSSAGKTMWSFLSSTQGFLGMVSNDNLGLITNNLTRMTISNLGRVGIGTSNPTRGMLDVAGFVSNQPNTGTYGFLGATNVSANNTNVNADNVSIYATNVIWCNAHFLATSDARTKNIRGRSDGKEDLLTLQDIQITDYTFKDTISKGNRSQKKVVAQQVKTVYPQAVTLKTDAIPDIYKKAPVTDGWVTLATDLKIGERVRLIGEKNEDAVHEILEVREGAFRPASLPEGKAVFVYGREVDDLHAIDYEAISMLNVSATQELARKLEAKDAEIAALKAEKDAELVALHAKLTALEARDTAREERLARLEQSLEDAARTVSVPVALKLVK